MNYEARITELQSRLAEQDHAITELSNEVYQQQLQISKLETQLRHLADRLQSMTPPDSGSNTADEVPPHY